MTENELHKLRNKIKLKKKIWFHFIKTNCYAYALGLDINENTIVRNAYHPGVISNYDLTVNKSEIFTYEQLIYSIYSDMDALGIAINPINCNDEIDNDAWKIALFITKYSKNSDMLYDYHFLRQLKDGQWYHKMYYRSFPNNLDDNNNVIINPETCYFENKKYDSCYALKLKR